MLPKSYLNKSKTIHHISLYYTSILQPFVASTSSSTLSIFSALLRWLLPILQRCNSLLRRLLLRTYATWGWCIVRPCRSSGNASNPSRPRDRFESLPREPRGLSVRRSQVEVRIWASAEDCALFSFCPRMLKRPSLFSEVHMPA